MPVHGVTLHAMTYRSHLDPASPLITHPLLPLPQVPAKTMHQEVVKVANWDKHMQRFAVSVALPNRPKACVCETADYIDVPGASHR